MKASPGRGKLSPQVTDEGAGQQHFTLSTPHPALRATCSPFCRYATFSPGAGEICPQGVKALAPGQAAKVDFRAKNVSLIDFCRACTYNSVLVCQILLFGLLLAFRASIREKAFGAGRSPRQTQTIKIHFPLNMAKRMRRHF